MDTPYTINKYQDMLNMRRAVQTGFATGNIFVIRKASHVGATYLTDMIEMPTEIEGYDDVDDLETNPPTHHLLWNDDTDMPWLLYVNNLFCQARTYVRSCARGHVPAVPEASTVAINFFWNDCFLGLTRQAPQILDVDGVPAAYVQADCQDFVEGLQWQAGPIDTESYHFQQLRRVIYTRALSLAAQYPNLSARIEQQAAVQVVRMVFDFLCSIIFEIADEQYAGAMQSDRAMFNLGFLSQGLITRLIDPTMATAIDPFWANLVKRNKHDFHADWVGANHHTVMEDWIVEDEINGLNLEQSIHEYKTEYAITGHGLKMARQKYGIGKFEWKGTTEHFAVLLDLIMPVDSTADDIFAGHGVDNWTLGPNIDVAQHFFNDCIGIDSEWTQGMERQAHWTQKDMTTWAKTVFTKFSLHGSLMGLCENDAFKGIRMFFSTNAFTNGHWVVNAYRDPNSIHTAGAVNFGVPAHGTAQLWMYSMLQSGWLATTDRIHFDTEWTENQITFLMRYGIDLSSSADVIDANDMITRWVGTGFRFVEAIECGTLAFHDLITTYGDVQEARFEMVYDVLLDDYETIQMKYNFGLVHLVPDPHWAFTPPRPVGLRDNVGSYIENFGQPSCMRNLLLSVTGPSASGGNKAAAPDAPSVGKNDAKPGSASA